MLLAGAFFAAEGCAPTKTVTITTTPDVAHLRIERQPPDAGFKSAEMDSKATIPLEFSGQPSPVYEVTAHAPLCVPTKKTIISFDAQTDYHIDLQPYKKRVVGFGFEPTKEGDLWHLKAVQKETVASLDTKEPPSRWIGAPVNLTQNADSGSQSDYPSFTVSPTSDVMVFQQTTIDSAGPAGFSSVLWRMDLPSGHPMLLTFNKKQQYLPAFDFGGDRILFSSNQDARTQVLFTLPIGMEDQNVQALANNNGGDTMQAYVSAGRDNLVFDSYEANLPEPQITIAQHDGSLPSNLLGGTAPQISPDGNKIVYIRKTVDTGKYVIYIVNTHGLAAPEQVKLDDAYDYFDPHWSPDGKWIAFSSSRRDGPAIDADVDQDDRDKDAADAHSFIWMVSADGKHCIQLTRNESFDSYPVWDRTGKAIYFRSNRGGHWNIWKLPLTDAALAGG